AADAEAEAVGESVVHGIGMRDRVERELSRDFFPVQELARGHQLGTIDLHTAVEGHGAAELSQVTAELDLGPEELGLVPVLEEVGDAAADLRLQPPGLERAVGQARVVPVLVELTRVAVELLGEGRAGDHPQHDDDERHDDEETVHDASCVNPYSSPPAVGICLGLRHLGTSPTQSGRTVREEEWKLKSEKSKVKTSIPPPS